LAANCNTLAPTPNVPQALSPDELDKMLENRAQMFGDDKIEQVRLTQMKRELHIGKETYKSEDLYIRKETYTILETRTNILRRRNREGETHD